MRYTKPTTIRLLGRLAAIAALSASLVATARAGGVRVQDISQLQGQRTNKLMGYGLVVGLDGTGDGDKNAPTMRALMSLHRRYHAPVVDIEELSGNDSVALVAVEATIPEFGAREGQRIDVVVSALGTAQSLKGGQLLTTPLQESMLVVPNILALAGGMVLTPDAESPRRGVIRGGATLEQDFFYNFIVGQHISLVLDDEHSGWPWAQMVAKAITTELSDPAIYEHDENGELVIQRDVATAIGPRTVRVRIPSYELPQPAGFISRVQQTELFVLPEQPARVVINRTTKNVSITGTVKISPTILQIPGLGTIAVGGGGGQRAENAGLIGLDPQNNGGIEFQELLAALSAVKVTPDQMIHAIEHLHRTGTLHAQLRYEE